MWVGHIDILLPSSRCPPFITVLLPIHIPSIPPAAQHKQHNTLCRYAIPVKIRDTAYKERERLSTSPWQNAYIYGWGDTTWDEETQKASVQESSTCIVWRYASAGGWLPLLSVASPPPAGLGTVGTGERR